MKVFPAQRFFCLFLSLILCICLLAGVSAYATDTDSITAETTDMTVNNAFDNDEMLTMLNAQYLRPQSTGYATLDQEIDAILAKSPDQSAGGKLLYAYLWVQENSVFDSSSNYGSSNTKYVNYSAMSPYDTLKDFIGTSGLKRITGTAITMPDSVLNHFYYILYKHRGACFDFNSFVTVVARYIGFEAVIHTGTFVMESWSGYSGQVVGHGFCVMTLNNGTKLIFDAQRDFRYAEYLKEHSASSFFGVPRDGTCDSAYNDTTTSNNHYTSTSMSFNEANCNAERDSRWIPTTTYGDVDILVVGDGTGKTSGTGSYLINQVVTLTATPTGCSAFDGWYNSSGSKVSSNATYSFYCTGDVVYTAKFVTKHSFTATVVAPTCTAQGYTRHVCSGCGASYNDAYKAALGHSLAYTTTATCTADGENTVYCTRCDYTNTTPAAALGHTYELTDTTATCTTAGDSTYTCSRCGDSYSEAVTSLDHDWTAWRATTASTATEVGTMARTCSRCSETETAALPATNPFVDVAADQYYYVPVLWAVGSGITAGTSDTTFAPTAYCTRAQVVTFLWRAAEEPAPSSTTCQFSDVTANDYYYNAVLWAVENGITMGTGDTTFSPNVVCTRAQIVTFLWRAAGKPSPTSRACPFTDVLPTEYYTDAVLWAVENGITLGTSDTTFSPALPCTRGQIVTFLFRWKSIS